MRMFTDKQGRIKAADFLLRVRRGVLPQTVGEEESGTYQSSSGLSWQTDWADVEGVQMESG